MHRLSLVSLRFVPASVFPAQRQPCYSRAASRPGPRSLWEFTTGIPSTDGSCATLKVADQSYHRNTGLISTPRAVSKINTRWPLLCAGTLLLCSPPLNWRLIRHKCPSSYDSQYSMLYDQQDQAQSHMQVAVRCRSHYNGIDARNTSASQYLPVSVRRSGNRMSRSGSVLDMYLSLL
jgi:hypothetical protein